LSKLIAMQIDLVQLSQPTHFITQPYEVRVVSSSSRNEHLFQWTKIVPRLQQVERNEMNEREACRLPTTFRLPIAHINPHDMNDIPSEFRVMLTNNIPPRRDDDVEGWFEYFQREIAAYKQAVRRIVQDLLKLREQHQSLSTANTELKTKMDEDEKKKRKLYDMVDDDKMDRLRIGDTISKRKDLDR
jgi:hypothetical protein